MPLWRCARAVRAPVGERGRDRGSRGGVGAPGVAVVRDLDAGRGACALSRPATRRRPTGGPATGSRNSLRDGGLDAVRCRSSAGAVLAGQITGGKWRGSTNRWRSERGASTGRRRAEVLRGSPSRDEAPARWDWASVQPACFAPSGGLHSAEAIHGAIEVIGADYGSCGSSCSSASRSGQSRVLKGIRSGHHGLKLSWNQASGRLGAVHYLRHAVRRPHEIQHRPDYTPLDSSPPQSAWSWASTNRSISRSTFDP